MATDATFPIRTWRPARGAAGGTFVTLLVLAVLVGLSTALAQGVYQGEARRDGFPAYPYSLPEHVLAMVLLAGLAVGIATFASLRRLFWLAVAVLTAVVAGPMVVLAVPVRPGLLTEDEGTAGWWRATVALVVLAILAAATWWNVRCLRPAASQSPATSGARSTLSLASLSAASVFSVLAMAAVVGQILVGYSPNGEKPGLLTIIGWAVLASASATLAVQGGKPAITVSLLIGAGLPLAAMYLAYFRVGGWPGVAGWELATSPVILSPIATIMLMAAPLLALTPTTKHVHSRLAPT